MGSTVHRGSIKEVTTMAKWYAVMADREDSDWGYGSHDLSEAKQMLKDAEYEDGYIAVIENDVCIEELTQDELFEEVQ
jgi:hypothetical protein